MIFSENRSDFSGSCFAGKDIDEADTLNAAGAKVNRTASYRRK
jgi:hypothetical protein